MTNSSNYTLLLMWEKAIEFKYRSYLDNVGSSFSAETWAKWKIRFQRNWDETNKLFLECIIKLQKSEILYTTGLPFVSHLCLINRYDLQFFKSFINSFSGHPAPQSGNCILGSYARLLAGLYFWHLPKSNCEKDRLEGHQRMLISKSKGTHCTHPLLHPT